MRLSWNSVWQLRRADNKNRLSVSRLQFPWRGLTAIVLGAMLAKWTWLLFAPRETSLVYAAETNASAAAENMFGVAAVSSGNAQIVALPNAKLVGVFAGSPGFAILELDGGKQVGVALGGEVAHGVKLEEIAADHVVIAGGGARQRVDLEKGGAASGAGVTRVPPPGAAPRAGVSAMPGSNPGVAGPAGMMSADQREALARQLMGGGPH